MNKRLLYRKFPTISIVLMSFIWIPSLLASELSPFAKVMALSQKYLSGCDKTINFSPPGRDDKNYVASITGACQVFS